MSGQAKGAPRGWPSPVARAKGPQAGLLVGNLFRVNVYWVCEGEGEEDSS